MSPIQLKGPGLREAAGHGTPAAGGVLPNSSSRVSAPPSSLNAGGATTATATATPATPPAAKRPRPAVADVARSDCSNRNADGGSSSQGKIRSGSTGTGQKGMASPGGSSGKKQKRPPQPQTKSIAAYFQPASCLGLQRTDDPARRFLPLEAGMFLGRTGKAALKQQQKQKRLQQMVWDAAVAADHGRSGDGKKRKQNPADAAADAAAAAAAAGQESFAELGIVGPREVSRRLLRVTEASPQILALELQPVNNATRGMVAFRRRLASGGAEGGEGVKPDFESVTKEGARLDLVGGDQLMIHEDKHVFLVVAPPQRRPLVPQNQQNHQQQLQQKQTQKQQQPVRHRQERPARSGNTAESAIDLTADAEAAGPAVAGPGSNRGDVAQGRGLRGVHPGGAAAAAKASPSEPTVSLPSPASSAEVVQVKMEPGGSYGCDASPQHDGTAADDDDAIAAVEAGAPAAASGHDEALADDARSRPAPTRSFWNSDWRYIAPPNAPRIVCPIPPSLPTAGGGGGQTSALPPRDMHVSLGQLYWKTLNSSTPDVGGLFLSGVMANASGRLAPPRICAELVTLLTWGPQTTGGPGPAVVAQAATTNQGGANGRPRAGQFFWDGTRMLLTLDYWKRLIHGAPMVMLPRLVEAAGPQWWITVLDLQLKTDVEDAKRCGTATTNNSKAPVPDKVGEAGQATDKLRMQSCRLEALIALLEASLRQPGRISARAKGTDNGNDSDSESDEEGDDLLHGTTAKGPPLGLLAEIRHYGAKPTLRVLARAMAHLWVTQRAHLGWPSGGDAGRRGGSKNGDGNGVTGSDIIAAAISEGLRRDRSTVVDRLAVQMGTLLSILRTIHVDGGDDQENGQSPSKQRRRGRHRRARANHSADVDDGDLKETEVLDILWNAMDMQMQEKIPIDRRVHVTCRGRESSRARQAETAAAAAAVGASDAKQIFLVNWVCSLRDAVGDSFGDAVGDSFAMSLAKRVGVWEKYEEMVLLL